VIVALVGDARTVGLDQLSRALREQPRLVTTTCLWR